MVLQGQACSPFPTPPSVSRPVHSSLSHLSDGSSDNLTVWRRLLTHKIRRKALHNQVVLFLAHISKGGGISRPLILQRDDLVDHVGTRWDCQCCAWGSCMQNVATRKIPDVGLLGHNNVVSSTPLSMAGCT